MCNSEMGNRGGGVPPAAGRSDRANLAATDLQFHGGSMRAGERRCCSRIEKRASRVAGKNRNPTGTTYEWQWWVNITRS